MSWLAGPNNLATKWPTRASNHPSLLPTSDNTNEFSENEKQLAEWMNESKYVQKSLQNEAKVHQQLKLSWELSHP